MADDINVGDVVKVFVTFYDRPAADPDRQPGDPATVTLLVRKPDGSVDDVTPVHTVDDSGYYEADLIVDQAGRWHVRWLGQGGVLSSEAEQSFFYVTPASVVEAVGS